MSVTIARSTVILSFFPFQQFNHFKLLLQVQLKILLSSYTSGFKSLEEKKNDSTYTQWKMSQWHMKTEG